MVVTVVVMSSSGRVFLVECATFRVREAELDPQERTPMRFDRIRSYFSGVWQFLRLFIILGRLGAS